MQDTYMDHNYSGLICLSSFCHICADLEDVQDKKEDRKRLLDRTRVSEYQTLHGGLNQEQAILLFLLLTQSYLSCYKR